MSSELGALCPSSLILSLQSTGPLSESLGVGFASSGRKTGKVGVGHERQELNAFFLSQVFDLHNRKGFYGIGSHKKTFSWSCKMSRRRQCWLPPTVQFPLPPSPAPGSCAPGEAILISSPAGGWLVFTRTSQQTV